MNQPVMNLKEMSPEQKRIATQERFFKLKSQYREAAEAMCEAVREEFPVGSLIQATLGTEIIKGRVVGHYENWWHCPGHVCVENVKTKKRRIIDPYYDGHAVVLLATGRAEL